MSSQEEVKKLLSSLIISSAKGLTVRRLFLDYKDEIGQDVPFQKYGFMSFEAYLRSIPDICVVHGSGLSAGVEPVVNEKIKHINDMVLKQKSSKTKKKYNKFPEPRRYRGVEVKSNANPPTPQVDLDKIELPISLDNIKSGPPPIDYYLDQCRAKCAPKKPKPQVSKSSNENNSNNRLGPRYQKSNTENIKQNQPIHKSVNSNNRLAPRFQKLNEINTTESTQSNGSLNHENPRVTKQNLVMNNSNSIPNSEISSGVTKMLNTLKKAKMIQNTLQNNVLNKPVEQNFNNDTPTPSTSTGSSSEYRSNSQSSNSELNFSEDDSFDDMIYDSEEDEVLDIETELRNLRLRGRDDEEEKNKQLPSFPLEKYVSERVNKKVKNKLQLLVSEHPDGIWCTRIPLLYKERFHEELDPYDFGFSCMSQMCEDLSDIFYMIRPGKSDWKIFDKRRPPPEKNDINEWCEYIKKFISTDKNESNEPSIPEDFQVMKQSVIKYPEEVLRLDDYIPYQWIEGKEMDFLELIVSEVYDPSKFWIQLKTESAKLEEMMNELQEFYGFHKDQYKMTREDCVEGLFVAAIFMGEFHRAKIVKIFPDNKINLYYFDYGTVSEVPLSSVFFLHQRFAALPQQAIRSRLAHVIPVQQNTMWPIAASIRFLELIKKKDLIGQLMYADVENFVLSLIITDVSHPDFDIHVNDTLLDEGYAEMGDKADICETSSAIVPNVHLYPTFDDIENGKCPTFGDLLKFQKLGFTNELIFKDYFDPYKKKTEEINPSDSASQVAELIDLHSGSQGSSTLTLISGNKNKYENVEYELKVEDGKIKTVPNEISNTPLVDKTKETPLLNLLDTSNISESIPLSVEPTLLRMKHEENKKMVDTSVTTQPFCSRPPPGFESITPNQTQIPFSAPQPSINFLNLQHLVNNNILTNNQITNLIEMDNASTYLNYMLAVDKICKQNATIANTIAECHNIFKMVKYVEMSDENRNSLMAKYMDNVQKLNMISSQNNLLTPERIVNKSPQQTVESTEIEENQYVFKKSFENHSIHVIYVDNNYYMSSQEIITVLLNSSDLFFVWLRNNGYKSHEFPSKAFSFPVNSDIFNELVKYNIAGVQNDKTTGIIIRLTLLKDVTIIIEKHNKLALRFIQQILQQCDKKQSKSLLHSE